jgi:flagellar hook-length control protein FliK
MSADPRAALPGHSPLPASDATDTTGTATANTAKPATASRTRPKPTSADELSAQLGLSAANPGSLNYDATSEPAPAAGSASAGAAASAAADPARAAAAALARLTADLPAGFPQLPAPRAPTSAVAQDTADGSQGTTALSPDASGPAALPGAALSALPPMKLADAASAAGAAPSEVTSTAASSSDTPDPGLLSLDFTPVHAGAEATAAAPAVQTPVGTGGWTEELGTHVIWMAHQGVSSASLRLQPEHLGPLEVRISIHDTTASVWFGASEPETRSALEAALPQLKEMFTAQGMTLTDAGVSREPPRDAQPAPRPGASTSGLSAPPAPEVAPSVPGRRRGLIDTYA